MTTEIDNLLARYFGGNASEKDMHWLENWLSESKENRDYFDQMTSLYEKLQPLSGNVPKPNTAEAKKVFMEHISKSNSTKPVIEFKRKPFYQSMFFRAASIFLLVIISAAAYYLFYAEKEIVFATATNKGQLQLPDETEIQLAENSRIVYSSNFSKKEKLIRLSGQASFNVGHKGNGKLKVMADETFVEDIGTVFEVKTLPDVVSVSVKEGAVHFYTLADKGLTLHSSETGIYDKKTKLFKILAKQSESGIAGSVHIDFQNMALSDAIAIIENAYNVDVQMTESSLADRRITVNFDGEDVDLVLQIMTETLNLNLEQTKTGYTLSKRN